MTTEALSPPPKPGRPRWVIWIAGILIGDLVIALIFWTGFLLGKDGELLNLLLLPSLFLVPMAGGCVASYVWRSLKPKMSSLVQHTFWMTAVALLAGSVAFHEGIICLIIVSPLFFGSILAGALLGRLWFKEQPTRLRLSILPLLGLGIFTELFTRVDKESVMTDEVIIHAPPSRVWAQLTSFPAIPASPRFWLFRMGLPFPTATTSSGNFVEAKRECIFSHDAVFKEKVVEFVPPEKLVFDILESPRDPELLGHLTLRRGQFVLRRNPDGTTTLIGSSYYVLHVRPAWYFDIWTRHIFRAVHLRVMEDIRRRAEASP